MQNEAIKERNRICQLLKDYKINPTIAQYDSYRRLINKLIQEIRKGDG